MNTKFQHAGLDCEVILTSMGHHCGYVAVPEGHPWFGLGYSDKVSVPEDVRKRPVSIDDVDLMGLFCAAFSGADPSENPVEISMAVSVHGGLTFASQDKTLPLWWFGFDCAHCDDGRCEGADGWKDQAFTEDQCRRLADQLAAVPAWPKESAL